MRGRGERTKKTIPYMNEKGKVLPRIWDGKGLDDGARKEKEKDRRDYSHERD